MSRRKSRRSRLQDKAAHSKPSKGQEAPLLRADADLWAAVTKSLVPLKTDHDRLHFGPLLDEKPDMSGRFPLPEQMPARPIKEDTRPKTPLNAPTRARILANSLIDPQPHNNFTRREMRRLSSGRQAIEARLDLHGLHQAAAHASLTGFLMQSRARGLRDVLIITGKGRSSLQDDLQYGEQEIGVLRRMVPLWLNEAGLSEYVTGFMQAPRNQGGEGALYVRLRRNS